MRNSTAPFPPLARGLLFFLVAATLAWPREKSAGVAMLLSVFPGGGQFYTGRYVPGVLVAGTELTIGYYAFKYHRDQDYGARNSMAWWGAFVFGFALADAYVGAKMYGFDIDTDINRVGISWHGTW